MLAATNRPEVLDPALLRPGRFDRQVTIPLPNQRTGGDPARCTPRARTWRPTPTSSVIARGTPGFSGADLANLVNEAAIVAVRDDRDVITADDLDAARDRMLLGRREGSNALLPEEKHAVAVHESGHALVAALSEHADPVAKVTILPAGQTLGVTEQLPEAERHLYSEDYLHDTLAVRLGGRAAELVVLGQGSTGAANDLAGATELATRMVREFGLSPALGPVGYPAGGSVFLGGGGPGCRAGRTPRRPRPPIDSEVPGCCGRPRTARSSCSTPTGTSSTRWSACCWRRRPSTAPTSTGWPGGRTSQPAPVRRRRLPCSPRTRRAALAVPQPDRDERDYRRITWPVCSATWCSSPPCRRTYPARRSTASTSARWTFTSTRSATSSGSRWRS